MKYIKKYEINKSSITLLDLSFRKLTKLPDLSEYINLTALYCYGNQLTSLPELPKNLVYLNCKNNKLMSLPELPKKLSKLICDDNQLTSLPELPDTLEYLYCDNNKLTSLPELPELNFIDCYKNQLPFINLKGYKKWYEENKHIIDKEGLEYAYELSNSINKYNI